ncbi:MAG: hypothetical protein WC761_06330 [Candidatus Paceibacterota bacterium]|jgi:hypothetical protein
MPPKEIDAIKKSQSSVRSTTAFSMLQRAAESIPPGGKSAFTPAPWCFTELMAQAKEPGIASTLGVKSVRCENGMITIMKRAA